MKQGEWVVKEINYWLDRGSMYGEDIPRLVTRQLLNDVRDELERQAARIEQLENDLDILEKEAATVFDGKPITCVIAETLGQ